MWRQLQIEVACNELSQLVEASLDGGRGEDLVRRVAGASLYAFRSLWLGLALGCQVPVRNPA